MVSYLDESEDELEDEQGYEDEGEEYIEEEDNPEIGEVQLDSVDGAEITIGPEELGEWMASLDGQKEYISSTGESQPVVLPTIVGETEEGFDVVVSVVESDNPEELVGVIDQFLIEQEAQADESEIEGEETGETEIEDTEDEEEENEIEGIEIGETDIEDKEENRKVPANLSESYSKQAINRAKASLAEDEKEGKFYRRAGAATGAVLGVPAYPIGSVIGGIGGYYIGKKIDKRSARKKDMAAKQNLSEDNRGDEQLFSPAFIKPVGKLVAKYGRKFVGSKAGRAVGKEGVSFARKMKNKPIRTAANTAMTGAFGGLIAKDIVGSKKKKNNQYHEEESNMNDGHKCFSDDTSYGVSAVRKAVAKLAEEEADEKFAGEGVASSGNQFDDGEYFEDEDEAYEDEGPEEISENGVTLSDKITGQIQLAVGAELLRRGRKLAGTVGRYGRAGFNKGAGEAAGLSRGYGPKVGRAAYTVGAGVGKATKGVKAHPKITAAAVGGGVVGAVGAKVLKRRRKSDDNVELGVGAAVRGAAKKLLPAKYGTVRSAAREVRRKAGNVKRGVKSGYKSVAKPAYGDRMVKGAGSKAHKTAYDVGRGVGLAKKAGLTKGAAKMVGVGAAGGAAGALVSRRKKESE